ncbi:MAG: hypothetical protein ACRDO4_03535 [Nocardioides sp.]
MAARTILHVGVMKSGTSHIQSRLFENKQRLLEAGVLVPGRFWSHQVNAVEDLLRIQRHGPERGNGDWQEVADEIAAHPGTAVVSMEFLGPSTAAEIAGVCSTIPNVEAVITVRDLNRTLAAMWQEAVQNGSSIGFRAYLDSVEETRAGSALPPGPLAKPGGNFWRQQGLVRMARDWRAVAPLTVVTVPPPGASRSILWERFCQTLGVPASGWADARRSNESIGAASAMLLRQVNEVLEPHGVKKPARRVRKSVLAKQIMARRKRDEPSIGLPVAAWVREQASQMLADLRQIDLTLLGDWEELQPAEVPGIDPRDVSQEEVIEAAAAALAGMIRRAGRNLPRD